MYVPKLSVIVAVYNAEKYLKQCLDSIVNQTLKDIEIICINDGSQDNSREIIQNYAARDSRIKLYTHENFQNKGLRETLKTAVAHASGKYTAFLESDDRWAPDLGAHLFSWRGGSY